MAQNYTKKLLVPTTFPFLLKYNNPRSFLIDSKSQPSGRKRSALATGKPCPPDNLLFLPFRIIWEQKEPLHCSLSFFFFCTSIPHLTPNIIHGIHHNTHKSGLKPQMVDILPCFLAFDWCTFLLLSNSQILVSLLCFYIQRHFSQCLET